MTNDLVYGRVTKVEDRFAKIDILAIGETPLNAVFVGIIQQENVGDFERSDCCLNNPSVYISSFTCYILGDHEVLEVEVSEETSPG